MNTCEYAGGVFPELRSHPWHESTTDLAARYYDFTTSPELIRSVLEDFIPWSRYGAIETFYALLQRLNHARSAFETNDCEFTGPHDNDQPEISKAFGCSGRLMLLFRSLEQNTIEASLASLKHALHSSLAELDEAFVWGLVGTTLVPTPYVALPESNGQQLGSQLMISFWAWGDSEADTMLNLNRLFTNLSRALRNLSVRATA
ncbi:MAG TPA: hypothetical protein VIK01_12230 [Polyangiaceae bacterium]